MAVRGTASGDAKWEVSHRYLTGQIERATHRTIVMHQLRPSLKVGGEGNPRVDERGFAPNWPPVAGRHARPAPLAAGPHSRRRVESARRRSGLRGELARRLGVATPSRDHLRHELG